MASRKPIAIFDIDGTIFRSSLTIELLRKLVSRGIFPADVMSKVHRSEQRWLDRRGHYDDYVLEVVRAYEKAIIGKKRSDIIRASREVITEQKFRTYRFTRNLLTKIRRRYFTIAISSSPLEVVQEYNKFLKFNKVYGWEIGMNERGSYTGTSLHIPARYKKELIVRYVHRHGLSLKSSIGVGDTEADIGFLELVSEPIAFNPNTILAKYSRERGWKIVIERKDLVVELDPKQVKFLKT